MICGSNATGRDFFLIAIVVFYEDCHDLVHRRVGLYRNSVVGTEYIEEIVERFETLFDESLFLLQCSLLHLVLRGVPLEADLTSSPP
ncbi:hypothetical protein CP556_18720 [Natrinema sp. CBA1119]|nr:hypothetical protein CP556_18720 [Natrinema sp. CBA1119]